MARNHQLCNLDLSEPSIPQDTERLAMLCKALGHPARINIVEYLKRMDGCVCGRLVAALPLAQSTVSQHLKILKAAGVVRGEIAGPRTCYCLNFNVIKEFEGSSAICLTIAGFKHKAKDWMKMALDKPQGRRCEGALSNGKSDTQSAEMLPLCVAPAAGEPCCGPPAGPPAGIDEKPGYTICHFVDGFISTDAGQVPKIKTNLQIQDHLGTLGARLGFTRNDYRIAPGLYAVGEPGSDAPVMVTANYKLSFDHLRRHLTGMQAWVLVLDTRGINVWCAAGKGTFGHQEVVRRVQAVRLSKVVTHRKLILPQLGAPGVSAQKVKQGCGFEVVWGPVRAQDLSAFLKAGRKAPAAMRRVTFSMKERMVLVPVEVYLIRKPFMWMLLAIFVLSGLGRHFFFNLSCDGARHAGCGHRCRWHCSGLRFCALVASLGSGAGFCSERRIAGPGCRCRCRHCRQPGRSSGFLAGRGPGVVCRRGKLLSGHEFHRYHTVYLAVRRGERNAGRYSHPTCGGGPGSRFVGRRRFLRGMIT